MNISDVKKHILEKTQMVIQKALGKKTDNLSVVYPPDVKFGDFSIEFFSVVKEEVKNLLGKASREEMSKEEKISHKKEMKKGIQDAIAKISKLVSNISSDEIIEKVSIVGPYVNYKVNNSVYFGSILSEVIEKGDLFGSSKIGLGQKVMVEYLSPNTNKPLHLGHLRNGSLGMSVSNILSFNGYDVVKSNLVNDRGVHICKSMLAWKKWGQGETPQSAGLKGDHFVGKWYVRYSQEEEKDPSLAEEVQTMLKKWEEGDPETMALWQKMNGWVYDGFAKTYQDFGLEFDTFYYESETYMLGKDIIEEGAEKGVFKRDKKNITTFFLPEEFGKNKDGSGKRVTVLRSDGTSVYITQDIGTALKKVEDHNLDRSIYVVGSEQIHHFNCLFAILKALGYKWAKNCYHLSYGMVYLPEGKMKSREGKVVDADNLINDVVEIVSDETKKRNPDISREELEKRARIIAVGAIKFHLLRVTQVQDIHFDPKESVALDGFTASYCQYAYVRSAAILRAEKSSANEAEAVDYSVLGEREEIVLAQKIAQFPEAVELAGKELNPTRIASYVFDVSQSFSQFYSKHSVLKVEDVQLKKARVELVKAALITIRNALHLLGIETLEEM